MSGESMLVGGLWKALGLIFTGDGEVYSAAFVSVSVAAVSTAIATAVGLPLAFLIAVRRFRGREFLMTLLNSLLALPTVVVGLFVYSLLRRGSLLGGLDLLFSPWAMILGQVVLAVPIVTALGCAAVASVDRAARETAVVLGATPARVFLTVAWEARLPLMAAVAAAGGKIGRAHV